MSLTVGNVFFFIAQILPIIIVMYLLPKDRNFHWKETIHLLVGPLLLHLAITIISRYLLAGRPFYRVPGDIAALLIYNFYFCKAKSYTLKKAIILMTLSSIVGGASDTLAFAIFVRLFPQALITPLWSIPYILLGILLSIIVTLLFVKVTGPLRKMINRSERLQTISASICVFVILFTQVLAFLMHSAGRENVWWDSLLFVGFAATVFVSFLFYTRSLKSKLALRQKEVEQENLQYYMSEIERQQTAMRRFKHDYQNILISIDSFLEEDDLDGLKHYYATKIKAVSDVITNSTFALEGLSKIKVKEVKGLLAAKLMLAQNLGIDTKFEADGEIDHIPIDSVALIRMLGIIMDNAIEELEALGQGALLVACFKVGTSVNFVVQNTCRPDIQPFRELKQPGFSTKGEGRGIGLDNLSEIAGSHANVTLLTNIAEGNFVQKLIIGEGV